MRIKKVARCILLAGQIFGLFFLTFYSFGQKPAKWKGKTATVDGVLVIKNPKTPLYSSAEVKLTEELKIGESEGQPEYMFGRIAGIAVDDPGCIYVADDKTIDIKVYDPKGAYLRTIGRAGQGPGEIGRPYDVFVNSRNELLIPDGKNYKLHVFSLDGKFLQAKSFGARFPEMTAYSPKGQLYVLSFGGDFSTGTYFELVKLDEDLSPLTVLHRIDIPPGGPLRESLDDKIPLFCVQSDGNLVMGFPKRDEYSLRVINSEGKVLKIISRDFEPVPIPKEDLEKARESRPSGMTFELPTHFPGFSRLVADDKGKIFALTAPLSLTMKSFFWDVFDAEGRYLANIRLPGSVWHLSNMKNGLLWKGGKLYVVEEDKDGYHIVKRYAVEWILR